MAIEPGAVFGDYRIEQLLGRGGMGAVYLARDERLGRRVALKLLSPELGDQPAFRDRFIRESRTAASLDHPHIVPIFEAGTVNDQPFIAMRYVQGTDLDHLVHEQGVLEPARAVRLLGQVADALDAAHGAGLVHRDVKPGNILVGATSDGRDHAYLSDFGLTKSAASGGGMTRTGQIVGTVNYVAPEQIEGRPIDHRADVYSLGCVLFEMLTGTPPFRRESDLAVLYAHVQAEVPSAHEQRAEVSAALDAVIATACAKDPADRYASAGELARAATAALAPHARPGSTGAHGFLFADLRGYTDFVERRGDDTAAGLLERYRQMVRAVVARHEGAEVRTEGDSFYVVFPSASRAVVAALEIVDEAARRSAEEPDAPIQVGVGVHAGETAETPEGPVGSAVNLAARICAQAGIGQVLVSDTVRGLTRTRQVALFEPVGRRRLKGIAEPVPLFRAVAPGAEAAPATGVLRGRTRRLRTAAGPWWWVPVAAAGALGIGGIVAFVATSGVTPPGAGASPGASTPAGVAAVGGTRIVYSRQVPFGEGAQCDSASLDAKLHVLDPDQPEQAPYRLTSYSDFAELNPAWSRDGSRIVFVGSDLHGPGGIAAVDPSGEQLEVLLRPRETDGASFLGTTILSVAPDASIAIHGTDLGLWSTQLDGSGSMLIHGQGGAEPGSQTTASIFDAVQRSDGRILVLQSALDDGAIELLEMAADGSDPTPLDLDLEALSPAGLALAADDDTLAVESQGGGISVGRISEGAESFTRLALGTEVLMPAFPAFSPDGRRLAFHAGSPGLEQIYVVDLETSEVTQLTDEEGYLGCDPTWQVAPDGFLAEARPEPAPGEVRRFEIGELAAGPYLNETVQPEMGLTFPDGWYARRSYVDGWSVHTPEAQGEVDSGRIQVGLSEPCGAEETVLIGPRPADVVTWIQGRADLEVTTPVAINLGGSPGVIVDVVGRAGEHCSDDPEFPNWTLFRIGDDSVHLADGERLRLIALDVRGTTISFLVFAYDGNLEAYWTEHADPLLSSLTFPTD